MENILKTKLEIYSNLQTKITCPIGIVGSTSLFLQGFCQFVEPNRDLDLVLINPTEKDIELIANLAVLSPNKRLKDLQEQYGVGTIRNPYFLNLNGIDVDIFSISYEIKDKDGKENFEEEAEFITILKYNKKILVSTFVRAILLRKKYNRPKDWVFLLKVSDWVREGFKLENIFNH